MLTVWAEKCVGIIIFAGFRQISLEVTLESQKIFRASLQQQRGCCFAAGLRARTMLACVSAKPGLGRGQIQAHLGCVQTSGDVSSSVSASHLARLTAALMGRNSRKSGRVCEGGARDTARAVPLQPMRDLGGLVLAHIR